MNAPTASSASPSGVRSDLPPRLDLPALRARASNDEELVREVLDDFLRDVGALRGAVDASVDDRHFADAGRAAHRIRGALLALGAGPAAAAASALEAGACALGTVTDPSEAQRGEVSALLLTFRRRLDEACAAMRSYLGEESSI
jgi:HPt (histidine-containing phosphotransfer) domain-containing protein